MSVSYCCDFADQGSLSANYLNVRIYYAFVKACKAPSFIAGNPPTLTELQSYYDTSFPSHPATIAYMPSDAPGVNDYNNSGTLTDDYLNVRIYYAFVKASKAPSFIAGNPPTMPELQAYYDVSFPSHPTTIVQPPRLQCTPTPTPTMTPTVTPTHTPTPTPTPGLQVGFKKWASFTTEGSSHEIEVEKKSGSIYIPNVKWTVDWKTVESGNNAVPGVATMGTSCGGATDFLEASGTLVFERYEGLKTFSVSSCSDSVTDPTETFDVQLFNLSAEDSYYDADPNAVVSFFPGTSSHIVWIQ